MTASAPLSDNCKDLLEKERLLFKKEYAENFLEWESKPREIGEPYLLHNPSSPFGVLLVHGLMAAPEEVRQWADFLYAKGYTVYAPRLAGHGTSATDLSARNFTEWTDSVERGHSILECCCRDIVVAGFSTGAGLALYQALHRPEAYRAVISISAPLKFSSVTSKFAELVNGWNRLLKRLGIKAGLKEFVPNHADNPEINYHRCPVHGIVQLKALMRNVYSALPGLSVPSLIIQASRDPKVDPRSGIKLFNRIPARDKHYREIDFNMHGIVRGEISRTVFAEVDAFMNGLAEAAPEIQ